VVMRLEAIRSSRTDSRTASRTWLPDGDYLSPEFDASLASCPRCARAERPLTAVGPQPGRKPDASETA
jgi:hypothetical protein